MSETAHVQGLTQSSDTPTTTEFAGELIDDIAVQRCVAGTLQRGAGMSRAERQLAVIELHRRGYSNSEIVRRTGVSIRTIATILYRRHGVAKGPVQYGPVVPPGCTHQQSRRVRLLIVTRVPDVNEARELLLALGLVAPIAVSAKPVAAGGGKTMRKTTRDEC